MIRDKKIDCIRCRHYYVTWDPVMPYGCRAMGFKSKLPPWRVVVKSSGAPCRVFEAKPAGRGPHSRKGE